MTKTVTGLFDDYSQAENAVTALERMGVPHEDISIVASNAEGRHGGTGRGDLADAADVDRDGDVSRGVSTGAALGGVGGLLAGLGLLAIPGLGPIVAAGWLASTAAGAAVGAAGGAATGGIVGALKNAGHTDEEAQVYSEGVRRGGTLVSARVSDDLASQANDMLKTNRSIDVGKRGSAYRSSGWSGFDQNAPAYSADEVARDRSLYSTTSL